MVILPVTHPHSTGICLRSVPGLFYLRSLDRAEALSSDYVPHETTSMEQRIVFRRGLTYVRQLCEGRS